MLRIPLCNQNIMVQTHRLTPTYLLTYVPTYLPTYLHMLWAGRATTYGIWSVSAQLQNEFGSCPSWTVSIILAFQNTTAYHLGWYETSSPSAKELEALSMCVCGLHGVQMCLFVCQCVAVECGLYGSVTSVDGLFAQYLAIYNNEYLSNTNHVPK